MNLSLSLKRAIPNRGGSLPICVGQNAGRKTHLKFSFAKPSGLYYPILPFDSPKLFSLHSHIITINSFGEKIKRRILNHVTN